MSFWAPPPKPPSALGWHRPLSPSCSLKVSPLALGGISLGDGWSEVYGKHADAAALLDAFAALGGNFVDTANVYNQGESEELLGKWMERRGNRDQMVVATKYGAGYLAHRRDEIKMQSNTVGANAKSLHVSVRESLRRLRTDYIDILYLHWWDFSASVEEVMLHLHALVMAKQVLYLGISDTPAWIVVKANEFARRNGLTPFSVYQGKWNAAFRDMEAEIIPMCEDQGLAIVSWASLGGGHLAPLDQRKELEADPDAPRGYGDKFGPVSDVLARLAESKKATFQDVALAYLFHQSTYVVPIVGVLTVEHVNALPGALGVKLSAEEIDEIHKASPLNVLFPTSFLFGFGGKCKPYNNRMTSADQVNYQMAAWHNAPLKQPPFEPRE